MSEADSKVIAQVLEQRALLAGVSAEALQSLAGQLVWRIGRGADDGPVVVRVGFASSAARFAELPRLKSATDAELEAAAERGELRVEWVGRRAP